MLELRGVGSRHETNASAPIQQHNEVQHMEELITAAVHTKTVSYVLSMTDSHSSSMNNEPTPAESADSLLSGCSDG